MGRQDTRSAALALVLLLVGPLLGCMGDTRPRAVIEWGMYPEEFEGLPVEVDGKVVGKLAKFGEATRTAFPLDKGDHELRVIHPRLECPPVKVAAELRGQRIHFILEVTEMAAADGSLKSVLTLRR